jgi:hypothetical protein
VKRQRIQIILVAGALWCGFFSAVELYRTVKLYINRPWSPRQPSGWRLGSAPAEGLRDFLTAADSRLSSPSLVSLSASMTRGEETTYLTMWTAYLLPRHQILPVADETQAPADYRLVYGTGAPHPEADLVFSSPEGAVYRLP